HVSGAINSCTTVGTIDFFMPFMGRRGQAAPVGGFTPIVAGVPNIPPARLAGEGGATDAQAILFGRAVGIVVVVIAILWAHLLATRAGGPIFLYLLNRYGLFTPGIATMFLLGILWKGTTHAGAL